MHFGGKKGSAIIYADVNIVLDALATISLFKHEPF